MLEVAVVGCGHWGPNLARNFSQLPDSRVAAICDLDWNKLDRALRLAPETRTSTDYREIIDHDAVNAVAIATPASTHFEIARECLLRGKHVFVEKPMCLTAVEAAALVDLARTRGRVLEAAERSLHDGGCLVSVASHSAAARTGTPGGE